ncbi:MAG: PIG-L deacetylase family protein [Gemmatimonadaceae bacterium]
MLPLTLGSSRRAPLTVLCLGAHADDIEIGCGGTLLTLLEEWSSTRVHWVVMSGPGQRAGEARRSARRLLRGARAAEIRVESFRDGFLPYEGAAVKSVFEQLKPIEPDLIFTHFRHDLHQDHRVVCDLTWNTFRDHTILEYEIPKYDADLAHPNVYVPLPDRIRKRKVRHLMSAFPTQATKRWYSPETFNGLMRIRGVECAAPEGYAEAFHGRKTVMSLARNRRD